MKHALHLLSNDERSIKELMTGSPAGREYLQFIIEGLLSKAKSVLGVIQLFNASSDIGIKEPAFYKALLSKLSELMK